jgi:hypothetical protein
VNSHDDKIQVLRVMALSKSPRLPHCRESLGFGVLCAARTTVSKNGPHPETLLLVLIPEAISHEPPIVRSKLRCVGGAWAAPLHSIHVIKSVDGRSSERAAPMGDDAENNLGNALSALGERASDTARLLEAVVTPAAMRYRNTRASACRSTGR